MKKQPATVKVVVAVRGVAAATVKSRITIPLSRGDRSKVTKMLDHAEDLIRKGTPISRPIGDAR